MTGYTCHIREQGPLFVEATVRYTFSHGGWYELTARVLAGDPAIRVDEQFDMGPPGSMRDYRFIVSLTTHFTPLQDLDSPDSPRGQERF